jgi:secreted trypsin-like serine protease
MKKISFSVFLASVALAAAAPAANNPPPNSQNAQTRIIGGQDAPRGAWPWMAALISASDANPADGAFCGGTLIDPYWVVTAAHCTEGESPATVDLVIGVDNLRTDLSQGIGVRIGAKRIVNHPDYDGDINDIALIELETPASGYPVIPLYQAPEIAAGSMATVIGWGDTNPREWNTSYPDILQQVALPVVSNQTCQRAYYGEDIVASNLCAGYAAGGKDTCQGDSGGPLMISVGSDWTLAGITSWGIGCAEPGKYGVYTRVSSFLDFIDNSITMDYFSCADVNGDGQVDSNDTSMFKDERINEHRIWIQECYLPRAACGDVNGDGRITRMDARANLRNTREEMRQWMNACWIPASQ